MPTRYRFAQGSGKEVCMGTIVLGYVPKPEGLSALRRAVHEAAQRNCALIIVNTDPRPDAECETDLDLEFLAASGVVFSLKALEPDADPADALVTVAHEADAELIVIGLRRRSRVGKLVLGSNAQRVLLDAQCPVLAVKADT
jgi:nucleotide-binding universal stress UspA family protein